MEIYISTDVETDGPIPGPNSMLSFASAAFTADKHLLGTFEANLETLPEASGDPDTMDWWSTQPDAWAASRRNLEAPSVAMVRYVNWVQKLGSKPLFVAYPAGFDFLFIYWYLIKFAGHSPFGFSAIDVRSFAMAELGVEYSSSGKKHMPQEWFDDFPHTHVALSDALEQGALFCNMLQKNRKRRS